MQTQDFPASTTAFPRVVQFEPLTSQYSIGDIPRIHKIISALYNYPYFSGRHVPDRADDVISLQNISGADDTGRMHDTRNN